VAFKRLVARQGLENNFVVAEEPFDRQVKYYDYIKANLPKFMGVEESP